jgi:hypothetical protein
MSIGMGITQTKGDLKMKMLNTRIKNKAMIKKMLEEDGVMLDSYEMVDAYTEFTTEENPDTGKLHLYIGGYPSFMEKEEIHTVEDAIDYIWKERKRFIPTMAQNVKASYGYYEWLS